MLLTIAESWRRAISRISWLRVFFMSRISDSICWSFTAGWSLMRLTMS